MSSALGLQLRRRTYAALIALWLIAAGLLARHHEAVVAHAVEANTGALVHGERLLGHHDETTDADIHGRNAAAVDHGACQELTVLHQVALADASPACVARAVAAGATICSAHQAGTHDAHSIYLIAPKTSPPLA